MKSQSIFHALTLFCCLAIVAVCFIPWVHYNSINENFTGYHVTRFVTGVYYGRPGIFITVFAAIIFLLTIWKNNGAKRVALFVAAMLFAYCIRTYTLFTGSLFEGEVVKLPGIYLIIIFSMLLLVSTAFPKRV